MAEVPYVGVCIGGPFNGKRMGSYDREQKVAYSPRSLSFVASRKTGDEALVECSHGAYRFENQEWHWREPA